MSLSVKLVLYYLICQNHDSEVFDNGYFPSVLEKDIERLLNKRK